jgi:hypothetical protein
MLHESCSSGRKCDWPQEGTKIPEDLIVPFALFEPLCGQILLIELRVHQRFAPKRIRAVFVVKSSPYRHSWRG